MEAHRKEQPVGLEVLIRLHCAQRRRPWRARAERGRDVVSIHDEGSQLALLIDGGPHADVVSTAVQRVATLLPANSDLAQCDIDILFHAVQARMLRAVGEGFTAAGAAHVEDPTAHLRDTLLECLHAMNQLHAMAGHERWQRLFPGPACPEIGPTQ
jgi:hypothetical protein